MYSDALDILRQCVEHIFSWKSNTGVLKNNPEEAEVVHFTSRFPKQPSFGESILRLQELALTLKGKQGT